jgi:hypothetical protein
LKNRKINTKPVPQKTRGSTYMKSDFFVIIFTPYLGTFSNALKTVIMKSLLPFLAAMLILIIPAAQAQTTNITGPAGSGGNLVKQW